MSSKVYVIANFEIKDTKNFRNYEKGFFGILKKHGGEFITFDDAPEKIEGEGLKGRVAMWTFNSKDEFDKWYNDCLLYTSPSPRDKRQSRMPSSA